MALRSNVKSQENFATKVSFPLQTAQAPAGAISIAIKDGKVVGEQVLRVTQGNDVTLYWTTDVEVSLHLHGYDIETSVLPGQGSFMSFTAHAAGRFPIAAHSHGGDAAEADVLYLEVYPR